jgi:hypothetical protein
MWLGGKRFHVCAVLKNWARIGERRGFYSTIDTDVNALYQSMMIRQKKRGSLSRAKSTPKEEGGGDKSEPDD